MAEKRGIDYVVNLIDQVTKPLQSITKEIDRLSERGKSAMQQIGFGVAGILATGASMKSALDPAIKMADAVSEISATGMGEEGLEKVQKFALGFSSAFGVTATDVVSSANEIIRAINGLTDDEVIAFTKSSNILAKATGSNVQQMGSYLSTMYGLFQKEADRMGKSQWVEKMSAQATLTANMYKSSGESLSLAFSNLTSKGTEAGIEMAEQFAVIGNMQNIMDGAKAGTAYRAFLENAIDSKKMQKKLGMNFIDAEGNLLPILKIIEKIKKQFGHLGSAKLTDILTQAFGTGSSVIGHLLDKTTNFREELEQIRKMNNLDEAIAISHTVSSVWERFSAILENIRIVIGTQVLKAISPFLNKIADAGTYFVEWLNANKYISKYIGFLILSIISLTAVIPIIMVIVGLFKLWSAGISSVLLPLKILTKSEKRLNLFQSAFNAILLPLNLIKKAGGNFIGLNKSLLLSSVNTKILGFNLIKLKNVFAILTAHFDKALGFIYIGFVKLKKVIPTLPALLKTAGGNIGKIFLSLPTLLKTVGGNIGKIFFSLLKPMNLIKFLGATLQGALWGVFTVLKTGLSFIFSPLMLISVAVIGLIALVYKFRTELGVFFNNVIKGFTDWGVTLAPIKQAFAHLWQSVLKIVDKISQMFGVSNEGASNFERWAIVGEMVGSVLAWAFQLGIDALALVIELVGDFAVLLVDAILGGIEMWQNFFEKISNGDILGAFIVIGEGIWNIFTGIFTKLYAMFIKTINWIIEKVNGLIGTDFKPIKVPIEIDEKQANLSTTSVIGGITAVALNAGKSATLAETNTIAPPTAVIPQPNTKIEKGVANTFMQKHSSQTKNVTNHINVNIQSNHSPQEIKRVMHEYTANG